jgi:adenylate kinase
VNILLLGPQGSGKGTQATRIEAEYGIPHIATGDMLRAAIEQGTELGKKVKPILERGELVPDELMINLIRDRLQQQDAERGFVLDGFPRTSTQADALDVMLDEIDRDLSVVFEFQVPDDVATERLLKRSELEGRTDDEPDVIARRLKLYHAQTEPLVEHYRVQGNLVGVHADRPVNQVFSEIQDSLEQAAARPVRR